MIDSVTGSNDVVVSGSGGSLKQRARKAQNRAAFARLEKRGGRAYARPPKATQARELQRATATLEGRRAVREQARLAAARAAVQAQRNAARRAKRAAPAAAAPARKARPRRTR